MSGIIRAPRRNTHDQLPRAALRDKSLSYRARGILARLLTNADGFSMTVLDLAAESREGEKAVRAACKELRAAGYMRIVREQGARGRWSTETFVYETPQKTKGDIELSTESRIPPLGGPPLAAPPDKSRQKPFSRKSSSSKAEAVPAAAPVDETMRSGAGAERKRRHVHATTGAAYWYDDEVVVLDQLVSEFGLDSVRAAVAALLGKGTDPLPTPLSSVLLGHRFRERQANQAAGPRRTRTAEDYAADAAAAAKWLSEIEGDRS